MYRTPHPDGGAHGSMAVFVRDNIKHHEEPKIYHPDLQATIIVTNELRDRIKISAMYCTPNRRVENKTCTEFFQLLVSKFIVGGDWNSIHCHRGSRLITPRGRKLKAAIDQFNCNVLTTGKPTHWPTDINKVQTYLISSCTKECLKTTWI